MSKKKKRVVTVGILLLSAAASGFVLGLRTGSGKFKPADYNADVARFIGSIKTEWLRDADQAGLMQYRLLDSLEYVASNETSWTAEAGAIVNGASIPQMFWSFIGGPMTGPYRDASVIHDVYCDKKERSWEETHWVFYDACREAGLGPWKANLMYLAVYHYGPIWDEEGNVQRETVDVDQATATRMKEFCEQNPKLTIPELQALDPAIWEAGE